MASLNTSTAYDPARRGNPAAAERAVYYVGHFGSAEAALDAVYSPADNDAFERAVCEELRALRHIEWTEANAREARASVRRAA